MKSVHSVGAAEVRQAAAVLARLSDASLQHVIGQQLARLSVQPVVQLVPFQRQADGSARLVVLRHRSDDGVWPGRLYVPGTVVRPADITLDQALNRLLSHDLQVAGATAADCHFVRTLLSHSGYGKEMSQIYWVELQEDLVAGELAPLHALPAELAPPQLDFIPEATAHYEQFRSAQVSSD